MVRLVAGMTLTMVLALSCVREESDPGRFDDDGSSAQGAGPTTGVGGGSVTTGVGATGGAPMTTSSSSSSMVTTSSSSSGMPCSDPGPEPNETFQGASYLGAIDDCDSSGMAFSGVLDGNDVDWFYYDGTDVFGCSVGPARTISADNQVRICKYPVCVQGTPDFTCPAGSSPDVANGFDGCCAEGEMSFGFGCTGTSSDDAQVFLRIDKPSGFACVNYSVSFHY
jgi:hypothetical protein